MDQIAITGMGLVCPLSQPDDGHDTEIVFKRLLAGQSGIGKMEFNTGDKDSSAPSSFSQIKCAIAGHVMDKLDGQADGPIDALFTKPEQRRFARFIHHGVVAADRAFKDAGLSNPDPERVGVIIGSGIGGIDEMHQASKALDEGTRLTPFFVPSCLINMAANVASIKLGIRGPSQAVVTACASGSHAIMQACEILKSGQADYILAGGAEASICPLGVAGFDAMNALAANFNDSPQAGSRPYDTKRCGFVMGEGAGVLMLERLSDARARGAKIYAIVAGYGSSADANHITNPDFNGASISIRQALKMAGIDTVGHINAHATSTPVGDASELKAFKEVFGEKLHNIPITANKGSIGHLLGAAGAVEAIFSIWSARSGKVPPVLNLETLDENAYLNDQPLLIKSTEQAVAGEHADYVLSTSFGFGGTNASLVLKVVRE